MEYSIKRNGDGYYVVMLGRHVMAKRTTKKQCQEWIDMQNGLIDSIWTGYKTGGNGR